MAVEPSEFEFLYAKIRIDPAQFKKSQYRWLDWARSIRIFVKKVFEPALALFSGVSRVGSGLFRFAFGGGAGAVGQGAKLRPRGECGQIGAHFRTEKKSGLSRLSPNFGFEAFARVRIARRVTESQFRRGLFEGHRGCLTYSSRGHNSLGATLFGSSL